ncbi:MAG: hypothetical protein HQK81_08540 [Desulfovibrionaceae bacterium]|nr:hypothetical protein [Desulfovibrionaceae bacterium]MBF0514097.1 hypothetical protein [Desulfovibrionaceae bacterium]
MDFAWACALAPLAGLAANILIQIGFFRLSRGKSLLRSVFAGFFCGQAATLAWDVWLLQGAFAPAPAWPDWPVLLLANQCIAAALGYCYFHFVNLSETARRIRILRELCASPRGLTREELLAGYNARDMVEKRFDRLLRNGQIALVDGKYVVRPGMIAAITKIMHLLKLAVMGRGASPGR